MFFRKAEPKIKIAATINHCGEHLINGVAVNARAFRDLAAEIAAVAAQEADRAGRGWAPGVGGKDATKVAVVIGRPLEIVMPPLLFVVLAQGYFDLAQPFDARPRIAVWD